MKRKRQLLRRRDRNGERAYVWGSAARLNDKPVSTCPDLVSAFGEPRGIVLCDAWMRGWFEKDKELKLQSRHAMKGTD